MTISQRHTHPPDPLQDLAMHLREYHGVSLGMMPRDTELERRHTYDHHYLAFYFEPEGEEPNTAPTKGV